MKRPQTHARSAVFSTKLGWVVMLGDGEAVTYLTFGHDTKKSALAAIEPELPDGGRPEDWNTPLVERIRDYATGSVDDFRDVRVALGRQTEFQRRVVRACRNIRYGKTSTYGELATKAGSPNAARAAGNCMAKNRVPLIVPCHRVVGVDGRLGGFTAAGGTGMKRRLLEMEAAAAEHVAS